ncbi:MAG: MerR family transcriptional regulator [Nitriliruptoraceae bacterium]
MRDEDAVMRIGEVALRTNVKVPTLRAWERRYGLLQPERTVGGHRLYSERDVVRVRDMSRLIADGWSVSAAAREVLRTPEAQGHEDLPRPRVLRTASPGTDASGAVIDRLQHQLRESIERFDSVAAERALDNVFARFEVPGAIDDVLLPVMRHLGDGWDEDAGVIAREHFATHAIRPRLQRLLRAAVHAGGRTCVAATPEAEEHDLGLLAAAVILADAGWRVHYLGPRTPTSAMQRAVEELNPQVVLVSSLFREHAVSFINDKPNLRPAALVVGGTGFIDTDSDRLGGAAVHEGPLAQLPDTLSRAVDKQAAVNRSA